MAAVFQSIKSTFKEENTGTMLIFSAPSIGKTKAFLCFIIGFWPEHDQLPLQQQRQAEKANVIPQTRRSEKERWVSQ